MRVTGGRYRGRIITCPPGEIRPAMDRMRESLFSILGNLEGCSFLDLFSGSAVVGIEAASRGASPVDLVELDRRKKQTILKNISIVETPITLHLMTAQRFLKKIETGYDIVYADPPFPMKEKLSLAQLADQYQAVIPGGWWIIHHPREESWPQRVGELDCRDVRAYGRSILRFYQRDDQSSSSRGNDSI